LGYYFWLSAIGSAAPNPTFFLPFFRFVIGGVGVGASSVAAYISRFRHQKKRGKLGPYFQFNIDDFSTFFSNYLLEGFGGADDWRWMMGIVALPALVYNIIVTQIPDSPLYLEETR
jgi:MFS family permease